jgi:hypothetical protein
MDFLNLLLKLLLRHPELRQHLLKGFDFHGLFLVTPFHF